MQKKTSVLSAAGLGATIAVMMPPVVGSKTRNALAAAVRTSWRFVSRNIITGARILHLVARPVKKVSRRRTVRKQIHRTVRRAR